MADDDDVVKRIKELLDNYVRPAVEMDGGAKTTQSHDGTKTMPQPHGCPSNDHWLKAGIEGMMKRRSLK